MPFTLIGRILFALPLVVFALGHFTQANAMAAMVPHWLPGKVFWVYFTGVALVAAAVAILAHKKVFEAGLGLGVMLLIFALTIHLPMLMAGNQAAMPSLLKDLSLAGAAFYIAGKARS